MKLSKLLSDEAVLAELGERIARVRIELQLTQAEAAAQAGVSKRTLERIESGSSAQMSSFIRLLRVLKLLPQIEQMVPESQTGPMELLRRKGKARQRASKRGVGSKKGQPWAWDDES